MFRVNADGSGYQILHSFTGGASDGARPYAGVTLVGGVLYGTTIAGGSADRGTVFRVGTDGTGFDLLHSFGVDTSDGRQPFGEPVHENGVLYGTASLGGPGNEGVVFKMRTDGSEYAVLVDLGEHDGGYPVGTLILRDGALYGMTSNGPFYGSVFRVRTDGTGYTKLHQFGRSTGDGRSPLGSLLLHGDTLFGTTVNGGVGDRGVLFSMRADGSGYRLLRTFGGYPNDGADPGESIRVDGNVLYGQARSGGAFNHGCLFRANLDGTGFQLLRSFPSTPADGGEPVTAPVVVDDVLCGLTSGGGAGGDGVLFALRKEIAVSGEVTSGGAGLPGVTLLGLPGNPTTGADGRFSASVPFRWTGTVTPASAGRSFSPASHEIADAQADQAEVDFSATACPLMSVGPDGLPAAWLGAMYTCQIDVSGGEGPYTFAVVSGTLPGGLALDSSSGLVSGTPTAAGTSSLFRGRLRRRRVHLVPSLRCGGIEQPGPLGLHIDEVAISGSPASNLNGVLESGEGVMVSPVWRNAGSTSTGCGLVRFGVHRARRGRVSAVRRERRLRVDPCGCRGQCIRCDRKRISSLCFAFVLDRAARAALGRDGSPRRSTTAPSRPGPCTSGTRSRTWRADHWAYAGIEALFHAGLTTGCLQSRCGTARRAC